MNLARNAALAAGWPVTVAAQTVDRQCASGLMAIGIAAKQIAVDGMRVVVAGGQDNISGVADTVHGLGPARNGSTVTAHAPNAYMPMLETAEFVASRYAVTREAQDAYFAEIAAANRSGPARTAVSISRSFHRGVMALKDKDTGEVSHRATTLSKDEGNRPETTIEGSRRSNP